MESEHWTKTASMKSLQLVMCFLPLLSLPWPSHGVSYFGESFCRIQAIQDVSTFHLSLQFKTSRPRGLLFLAGGVQDYLILELLDGRLQVRMETGSGETMLALPLGLQLSNLVEHTVALTLKDSLLTLMIDSKNVTLPKSQEDLNIDYGIFLGGTGGLEAPYLDGSIPPLRGCISNVKFESHNFDIIASEPMECEDTKETCSSEFEAKDGETTSFISPESFISFPTWSTADTRTLEFLIKTTIEDALLVFHAGHQTDFIAVGMMAGYLKGVLVLGGSLIVLDNPTVKLDDDQWHRIRVQVDQSMFEMNVDSEAISVPLSGSEVLDLTGNLYVGGVQRKIKELYQDGGFLTRMEDELTSESFIGCLGEIKVNQRDRSLQDALVTKAIHVKCEGDDYDYSSYYDDVETPATSGPIRIQYQDLNPDERHCYPTKDTPELFRNITKLLDITPLLVPEGGEVFFNINNLRPTIDLNTIGIRQSQIIFTLQEDPWYGLVDMNVNSKRTKKFTLLDVINKKIKYLHDGNERYGDKIHLEVVTHSYNQIPECLKTPQRYILPVEIIPVNDIPQLSVGNISVTEYGRTRLSSTLIKIIDSDTRCDELVVTVISETGGEGGFVESENQPGKSISEFTCRQLKDGEIFYTHKGGKLTKLTLRVSDGHSTSRATTLGLIVTRPTLHLVTNTGILLPQEGNSTIGIQKLAVSAIPRNGDIVYNVTQALRFGELQILTRTGTRKPVMAFRQSDLEQNLLTYVSTDSQEHEDIVLERIQFDVHLGQVSLLNNTFLVKITPYEIEMATMAPLEIKHGGQTPIKKTELEAHVKEKSVPLESIRYVILKVPTQGTLQLKDRELTEGDSFTQQDILLANLNYRVRVHRTADTEDQFQFRVLSGPRYSPVYTYPIRIRADPDVPVLTNERLIVLEGGENVVNNEHLWVQTQNSSDFVYRIDKDPRHGRLIRESPPGQPRFDGAIRVFSNEDLLLGRLIYKHDGSESSEDQFTFLAIKQVKGSTTVQTQGQEALSGVFRISIQSKNDHVPFRVVDKTFNVVRNGQRLLTTDDLRFHDDDSDFNDTQLVYIRVGILSGNIVAAKDSSQPLFRFTQADMKEKKVLFVHHGADRERFQLQVSDGLHKTTALLQIQASEPYLRIVNNTIIVIDHGSTKTLNTSLLSAESNMDIRDLSEIRYEVTSAPNDGSIIVSGIEASWFTQEDLRKGVVSYQHDDHSLRSKDSFSFQVQSKGLSEDGTFRIKIFKQGYLSQPEIITNEVIISFEGEHTEINQDHLKVEQADILPSEMVFTIKKPPSLGHVVMLTNSSGGTAPPSLDYIYSFSQEDLNRGQVLYVAMPVQGEDVFSMDVSNGFTTVEDLQVSVTIVPRLIPVAADNFTLAEGGSIALSEELLNVTHPFYRSSNIDFIVEEHPKCGNIRYLEGNDDELTFFTWDEVKRGLIYYLHDGSESPNDSFTLSASAYELQRRSVSIAFAVTILLVNDEPPRVVLNTGLELLVGEEAEITTNMLNSEDEDTPPEELVYTIEGSSSGFVALKVSPADIITNFTQAQINNGEVVFIHEGSQSGGFGFTVTDGEHTSPLYHFIIKARELTISMETEMELMVYPGTREPITSKVLKAVTNEEGDEITYNVLRVPRLGRVISATHRNHFEEVTSFTQSELEAGSIFYEHQMPSEPFWEAQDSVELLLFSQPAQDMEHTLPITVSYDTGTQGNASRLWRNTGLTVLQGQREIIDSSKLDASNLLARVSELERNTSDVVFEVRRFPSHGKLTLGSMDLSRNAPYFTREDLGRKDLRYHHQDMEASSDSFSFRVSLRPQERPQQAPSGLVIEETFRISIKRRDYNPPELVSLDLLLEVLQGSTAVLTKQYLNTIDEDNAPDEVLFVVTKAPNNGLLMRDSVVEIDRFTQADINAGRVVFVSDGSLSDGFMEFIVSDGKHRTEAHSLHIGVLARTLTLAKAEEIQVRQGDDETLVTESMLKATTGGPNEEEVLYKITSIPKYAAIMVDRQPTSAFTQKQIKQGRVSVRFVKSTSPKDSVAIMARSRAANISTVLNITAKPLVKLPENLLLPRATTVLVDGRILDASPLANKIKAVPTFSITHQPQGARFVRKGGRTDGQPINAFTQKELEEGRVALELANDNQAGDETRNNQVHFLLTALGVPPAEGTLTFQTAPYNASVGYGATLLKVPPNVPDGDSSSKNTPPHPTPPIPRRGDTGHPHGSTPTTPSHDKGSQRKPAVSARNNLWAIIIPILVILLLLVLAAVLAYYLVRRNKTGQHNVQTVSSKPKNGEVNQETFRKTDPGNNISMSNMDRKEPDPELLQHCRTTNPALKKNQYWV